MELNNIKELIKLVEKSSLTEFSMEEGDFKISMSKNGVVTGYVPQEVNRVEVAEQEENEEEDIFITSPIVGTFYAAEAPDVPPFVKVGDIIKKGQTVCILEAMKLMNEIESDFDGEIVAILVSNEQKVEYGQPLFRVKKI